MRLNIVLLLIATIGQFVQANDPKNLQQESSKAKKLFVAKNGMTSKDVPAKSKDSVRISVIGDSITHGLGHWPQKLADLINSPYIEIADFGATGSTISQSAFKDQPYKPYRFTDQYEMFKASQPDIVMFMLGSCDAKLENWGLNSRQNWEEEYYHWLEYLTQMQNPHPVKVYALIPPPILPCINRAIDHVGVQVVNDFFPSRIPDIVYRLNTAQDADKRGQVEIIDIFGFMGGHDMNLLNKWCEDNKIDGFHYGFDKIAEAVYTHLMTTLNMDDLAKEHKIIERGWLKGRDKIWKAGEIIEQKAKLNLTQTANPIEGSQYVFQNRSSIAQNQLNTQNKTKDANISSQFNVTANKTAFANVSANATMFSAANLTQNERQLLKLTANTTSNTSFKAMSIVNVGRFL